MAHEISHVVARHSVRNIQAALGVSMAYELVFGDENNVARDLAINVDIYIVSVVTLFQLQFFFC